MTLTSNIHDLERSAEEMGPIFETMPDAVIVVNTSANITHANSQACRMFGYPLDTLQGQALNTLMPERFRGSHGHFMSQYFANPRLRPMGEGMDLQACRKDSTEFPVEISLSPIRLKGEMHVVAAIRDITLRKNEAKELELARQQAEEANLGKSTFLAKMSHEIRTPLNAIIGTAELLRESLLNPEQGRLVATLNRAGDNLLDIINDILDMSKVESGQIEIVTSPFDLVDMVNSATELMKARAAQKDLELRMRIDPNVPTRINGDALRTEQVLINLLGNAVKFTEQGRVSLRVSLAERDSTNASSHILFTITDSGIGIPKEKLTTIFDPFTQVRSSTTSNTPGTGLGLSISRELTELMGGRIWAESTEGQGTSFYVQLPFSEWTGDDASQPQTGMGHDMTSSPPQRILLVEDSEDNRLVLTSYLKESPHSIDIACNGEEGVAAWQAGSYDLVLMDIQMPVMDGYSATRRIRELEKETLRQPVVIYALTAYAQKEDQQSALEAGCNGHLTKPIRKRTLIKSIAQAASGYTLNSDKICENDIDPDLLAEIPGYLQRRRTDCEKCKQALTSGDWGTLISIAHKLKGHGGSYGFPELSRLGHDMEASGKEHDEVGCRRTLNELASLVEELIEQYPDEN